MQAPLRSQVAGLLCGLVAPEVQGEARYINGLALPVIATYILGFLNAFVAQVTVGHVSTAALAAAALSNMYANSFGNSLILGSAQAVDTLAAQAFGAGNYSRVGLIAQRGIAVSLASLFPVALVWWNAAPLLRMLGQDEDVVSMCEGYLRLLLIGLPASTVFEVLKKYLLAVGLATPPMVVNGLGVSLSAVLHYVLVYQTRLGFYGSPIATAISQWFMLTLMAVYILNHRRVHTALKAVREAVRPVTQPMHAGLVSLGLARAGVQLQEETGQEDGGKGSGGGASEWGSSGAAGMVHQQGKGDGRIALVSSDSSNGGHEGGAYKPKGTMSAATALKLSVHAAQASAHGYTSPAGVQMSPSLHASGSTRAVPALDIAGPLAATGSRGSLNLRAGGITHGHGHGHGHGAGEHGAAAKGVTTYLPWDEQDPLHGGEAVGLDLDGLDGHHAFTSLGKGKAEDRVPLTLAACGTIRQRSPAPAPGPMLRASNSAPGFGPDQDRDRVSVSVGSEGTAATARAALSPGWATGRPAVTVETADGRSTPATTGSSSTTSTDKGDSLTSTSTPASTRSHSGSRNRLSGPSSSASVEAGHGHGHGHGREGGSADLTAISVDGGASSGSGDGDTEDPRTTGRRSTGTASAVAIRMPATTSTSGLHSDKKGGMVMGMDVGMKERRSGDPGLTVSILPYADANTTTAGATANDGTGSSGLRVVIPGPGPLDIDDLMDATWPGLDVKGALRSWPEYLSLGLPSAAMLFTEWASYEATSLIAGIISTETLAAHTIYATTASLSFMPCLGYGVAVGIRVGQRMGEKSADGARLAYRTVMYLGAAFVLLNGLAVLLVRPVWGRVFTDDPATLAAVSQWLWLLAPYTVFDGAQCLCSGVLRGLGRPTIAATANVLSYVGVGLGLSWAFGVTMGYGLAGIWMAYFLAVLTATVLMRAWIARLDWDKIAEEAHARATSGGTPGAGAGGH